MNSDKKILVQYKKLWLNRLCVTVCLVFVMVALKSPAFAATTRTVAIHPSGTSVPGGYDATYTSMSAMEAAENADLVALDRFLRVEIVNSDGNWSTADTTAVTFDGWNCDRSAGQYVEIEVMSGARNPYTDGKWSTSHYRLSASSQTLWIDNDAAANNYFEADFIGLQVEASSGVTAAVRNAAYHKTIKFIASHFRNTNTVSTAEVFQLTDNTDLGTVGKIWFINCIFENPNNADEIVRATSDWSATAYFYNCTVVGGGIEGLDVDTGTVTVKNCAVFNNDNTDILAGGVTPDYNASDDSVGTNWVNISPAAEVDGWNAAVTDYANGDYRVKDTNSVLYQAGLSQNADSNVPSEDIAGNARPVGSNPVSIGAFDIPCGTNLVMVTGDGGTGDPDDVYIKALFESWGWTVTIIDDGASQAVFDNAAASNDVMYIAQSVGSGTVGTKPRDLTIPVVDDEDRNWDEMGFTTGTGYGESVETILDIQIDDHYITDPFPAGNLTVYSPGTDMGYWNSAEFASGITKLATKTTGETCLFVADTGAQLNGLTAPARRVGFFSATSDTANWHSNTETLLKRSLGWAAGCGAGGGGTNSDPVLNSIGNKSVDEGQLLQFTISATDPDAGDTLTYSASSLPTGASFDPGTQTFSWTPNVGDAGTYPNVQFTVIDDGTPQGSDSELITITVNVSGGGGLPAPDLNEYSCNMKITIDNTKVAGSSSHSNFPVLISLTDDSLKNTGCGIVTDIDGYDIIFVDSTKTIQLYHEVEKYDGAIGEFVSWVRIPTLSATSDTDIYLYYGNSNISSSQENPTDVWDSNYTMVYHLNEPSGTSGSDSVTDSTGNTGGTPSAGISFGQSGRIGDSVDFSSGTGISLGSIGSSLLAADATVSFWLYSNNIASPARQNPFNQAYGGWGTMTLETAGHINWFFGSTGIDASPYGSHGSSAGLVTNGSWIYVVGVRNSSGYTYDWYKNGAYVNGSTYSSTYPVINNRTFTIGDGYVNPINGRIDEFRISNTPRSADWIQTSYNNQSDPSSFYSTVKQCPGTIPPISEFICSIPITIDSSKVSGTSDLINFPVLISLTNTALKNTASCGSVQNSNGYDIIFSDSTQTTVLDHEIEKYDGAAGELVAWVRVPTLKYNEDTVINIHFGHSSVCGPTENPAGVWDSNYKGVWHLNEDPTASAPEFNDSTANGNNGNAQASMDSADQVSGQIGGAIDFDGTDDMIEVPSSSSLNPSSAVTVEAWIYWPNCPDEDVPWVVKADGEVDTSAGVTSARYALYSEGNSGCTQFDFCINDTNNDGQYCVEGVAGSTTVPSWYHLVGTFSGTELKIYRDATLLDTKAYTGTITGGASDSLTLGRSCNGCTKDFFGTIDEVRISDVARSADWIITSYNNQSDPSSFYSVGSTTCSLGGFSCNRRITINSTKVEGSSDLTNFPLLIKAQNDCNLKSAANGGAMQNSNGWDIMFTDSDGVTQLDHEIEEYDETTGDFTAWVRIPTLPYNSDKDIYMFYGKSGLTCDFSNPNGVWDSSYEAVYHLNDDFEDSTSHNRDATAEDTDTYTSVIADGEDFGPQDEIVVGNWNFSGDELTLQAWARFDDFDQNDPRVLSKASGTSEQNHVFMLGLGGNLEQHLRMRVKTGTDDLSGTTTIVDTDDPLSANNWYLIAGTYDGSNMRLLSNGVDVHSAAKTGNIRLNSWNIALGNSPGNTSSTTYSLDGKLDEVRILSAARSADWLRTEYNNQSDPDSFYSMSQDTCGGVFGFNFQYCKKITVDNTQVDSDLTNFPLLINITNDDDLKTVANGGRVEHSQGYDIVFRTSGCGNLEHEIEKYDGDNGDLVAWVSVPTLSSTTPDTEIYMYYGANVICSTENPTAVWDSSYAAVWHLKEDPSGTAPQTLDSTANDNDGTSNGSMTTADLVDGKIGNGIDFDGSNDWIESPNSGSLDITGNAITLSAWVKSTADQNDDAGIINKSYSANYNYMLNVQGSDQGNFRVRTGGTSTYLTGSTTLTAGQWYFLYGIYDGVNAKVYLDGAEDGTDARAGNIESSGAAPVVLGRRRVYPTVDDRFFTGVIDEVHISNVARTTDWMKTEFRNQNDPGNFYTVGSCFEQTTSQTNEWKEEFQ